MRVDAAVETGSVVGTDYDSMIAKVIAYGPDRATALARLDRALADTAILGLTTNTGFLRSLLAHEDVRAGEMDTGLIGRLTPPEPPLDDEEVARTAAAIALTIAAERAGDDPFERRDGWRLGGVARAVVLAARGRRRRAARRSCCASARSGSRRSLPGRRPALHLHARVARRTRAGPGR